MVVTMEACLVVAVSGLPTMKSQSVNSFHENVNCSSLFDMRLRRELEAILEL